MLFKCNRCRNFYVIAICGCLQNRQVREVCSSLVLDSVTSLVLHRLSHLVLTCFLLEIGHLVLRWSNETEKDWKESESIENSQKNNKEIHAEVIELEKSGRSECKNEDSKKF